MYTLNLYNIICQLYHSKLGKEKKNGPNGKSKSSIPDKGKVQSVKGKQIKKNYQLLSCQKLRFLKDLPLVYKSYVRKRGMIL